MEIFAKLVERARRAVYTCAKTSVMSDDTFTKREQLSIEREGERERSGEKRSEKDREARRLKASARPILHDVINHGVHNKMPDKSPVKWPRERIICPGVCLSR
jgi:hypothetical protein